MTPLNPPPGSSPIDAKVRHASAYQDSRDLNWEERARINPLFAIMSVDAFLKSGAEPTAQELKIFYERGEDIWMQHFETGLQMLFNGRPPAEVRVLEFGCGMGRNLGLPARRGCQCFGVDISPTQIELARKHFPYGTASFEVLTGLRLPFPSGHFDYVMTFAVLQHLKQTSVLLNALSEMCRVLKPGGLLKIHLPAPMRFKLAGESIRGYLNSFSGEKHTLMIYRMEKLPFIVRCRWIRHTNLSGAAFYFNTNKILSFLRKQGIKLSSVEFNDSGFSFITGTKQA
jgi:SAM-dependent methyltransferase